MNQVTQQIYRSVAELDDDFFLTLYEQIHEHQINYLIHVNGNNIVFTELGIVYIYIQAKDENDKAIDTIVQLIKQLITIKNNKILIYCEPAHQSILDEIIKKSNNHNNHNNNLTASINDKLSSQLSNEFQACSINDLVQSEIMYLDLDNNNKNEQNVQVLANNYQCESEYSICNSQISIIQPSSQIQKESIHQLKNKPRINLKPVSEIHINEEPLNMNKINSSVIIGESKLERKGPKLNYQ